VRTPGTHRAAGGIGTRRTWLATGLALALLAPGQASAAEGTHVLIETLGSVNQPSFVEPKGLAVDQGSGDVYAIDGRNEVQKITVSATGGSFTLEFEGKTTAKDLPFNAEAAEVRDALREIVCGGENCLIVKGGPGDGPGSEPYIVEFGGPLSTTDLEEVKCVPGSPTLSGGSGCTVETTKNGVNGTISRWHTDGTPAEFSALGSNTIDGLGPGSDQTPLAGLHFFPLPRLTQIAVDESGGETDGDIYATQFAGGGFSVFAPNGAYLGQLTEYKQGPLAEGPLSPLVSSCGVGVDGNGDVYLGDVNLIHKYDPAANPAANGDSVANFTGVGAPCGLATGRGPTAGALFAISVSGETLFKLDASTGAPQYGGNPFTRPVETEPGVVEMVTVTGITTVTADPVTGYLYAARNSEVLVFDASGPSEATLVETIPAASKVTGIAVDGSSERLYLAREGSPHIDVYAVLIVPEAKTEAASEVAKTTATVSGTLNPEGVQVTECKFEYGVAASYGQSAPCEVLDGSPISGPGDIPADEGSHSVSAELSGLDPNTTYHYRLVVGNTNAAGEGEDKTLETLGPPRIDAQSVSEVTATEAKIEAEVDPRGEASVVAVEYVSEAQLQASGYAEASVVPSPPTPIGAGIGPVEFSQNLTGLKPETPYHFRILAENKVDPPAHGEDRIFTTFPVAGGGLLDDRAWELVSPPQRMGEVWPPEPFKSGGGSCKSCVPGWSAEKAPMQASPDGDAIAYQGEPFFPGLAAGANSYVSRRGEGSWQTAALSTPQLEEQVFKAFSPDLSKAVMLQAEPSLTPEAPEDYANLYLREEGKAALTTLITSADEPPQRSPGVEGSNPFHVTYAGANAGTKAAPAFSHVVFQANDALTEEEPGIAPEAPAVDADETDLYEWSGGELHLVNVLPGNSAAAPNAVIGSGQLLRTGQNETLDFDHAVSDDGSRIFWSERPSGQLYVREGAESTIQIPDPGKFITATPDGSKVLLSNGHIYGLEEESTTDLTEGQGGFQGIAGASEDLSRVYFVDSKALTPPGEENASGEAAEEGELNLYLSEEGATSFIARLAARDNEQGDTVQLGVWRAGPGSRLAQATADGRFLAFQSTAPLTGYDNTVRGVESCIGSGNEGRQECAEVFEYDALKGSLACVSCNPTGLRPLGGSKLSLINSSVEPFPQPSNLPPQGQGRLFFESLDKLSAADTNGRIQDVYQWEPQGVGGCSRPDGCISLISSGHDPKDSQFIDASDTGEDVFFTTRARLLPRDENDFMDLYDARVGGGIAELLSPPCQGEACKGAGPQAPSEPSAASATFSGPPDRAQRHRKHRKHRKHGHRRRHRRAVVRERGGNR
jgi:hypothetical protein